MSAGPNFCSNCGERLDTSINNEQCPKCHSPLHEFKHLETAKSIIEQLPYKNPGTAALIAFIGGIFALPGIGHIYVGKVGLGIGILILGLVLYVFSIIFIFIFPPIALIISIVYLILFIWQISNTRKLAKRFNESVKATGKEPW